MSDDYSDLEMEIEEEAEQGHEVAELPAPVDWMSLSIHEFGDELGRLRLWVGQIVTEWALPSTVVLPCWEQHAAQVQLLGALRDAYDTLYHEMQPGTGSVDWQRYWSWARGELSQMTGSVRCTLSEHHPDKLQKWARDLAEDGVSSDTYTAQDARVDLAVRNHLERSRADSNPLNVVFVDFTAGR